MAKSSSKKKGKNQGGKPAPNSHASRSAGTMEVIEELSVSDFEVVLGVPAASKVVEELLATEFEIEFRVPMAKGSSKKKGKNQGGTPASNGHALQFADSRDLSQSNKVAIPKSENLDWISELPNDVKGRILSYLPTRSAVATAILSKAWRHAWMGVFVLDFNDLPPSMTREDKVTFSEEQYVCFTNYVNRILLHNNVQCLIRLHFEMYDCFDANHICEWMLVIARLQVLDLCCISRNFHIGHIEVPNYLFLEKYNLHFLKLEGFRLNLPPSSFYLPCLLTVFLTKAVLCDNYPSDPWMRFLSSCPVLEYLNIEHCEGLGKLSVCSPSIKILRVVLKNDPQREILIETPNLEVLYLSLGIKRLEVNDLSSLIEVRLDIWTSSDTWIELLQKICYTKTLVLHQVILDGSTGSVMLPTFQNLTHLEVGFTDWSIVLQIIKHAPKLASLTIHKLMFDWPRRNPRIKDIPLERIEYLDFDMEEGFKVVGYFLRHSSQLKKVIICACSSLDSTTENELVKKLLKQRRASIHCKIIFLNEGENYKSEDDNSETEASVDTDSKSDVSVDSIYQPEKVVDADHNSESERGAVGHVISDSLAAEALLNLQNGIDF